MNIFLYDILKRGYKPIPITSGVSPGYYINSNFFLKSSSLSLKEIKSVKNNKWNRLSEMLKKGI